VAGPLVGVIAGGILAGAFGLIAERRSHMNARSREVAQLRRVEYFSAIDSVHRLRRALEQFRAALSGRWQPDDDDRSAEAEQMRERDKAGAVSFNRLDAAIDELRNTTLKVRAVGSERVSSAMDALDRTVGAYFMEAFAEIPTFKADRFRVFFDSYTEQSTALVGLMRRDLEIDRIYIPRQTDEPEPKKLR
jgi:hypothetical protein